MIMLVEEAVKLKEAGKAKEVIAIHCRRRKGTRNCYVKALAVGADRGIHVKTDSYYVEPLGVAKILKKSY